MVRWFTNPLVYQVGLQIGIARSPIFGDLEIWLPQKTPSVSGKNSHGQCIIYIIYMYIYHISYIYIIYICIYHIYPTFHLQYPNVSKYPSYVVRVKVLHLWYLCDVLVIEQLRAFHHIHFSAGDPPWMGNQVYERWFILCQVNARPGDTNANWRNCLLWINLRRNFRRART
jgi:hypothetical protein